MMKSVKKKGTIIFCALIIVVAMEQCTGIKRIGNENTNENMQTIKALSDINTLVIPSYNMKIIVDQESNRRVKGYIKAVRGKGVMVSIRSAMNMEVARMWIMNDTITLLNRVDKKVKMIDVSRYLGECNKILHEDWPMFLLIGKYPVKEEIGKEREEENKKREFGQCEIREEMKGKDNDNKRIIMRRYPGEMIIRYEGTKSTGKIKIPDKIDFMMKTGDFTVRCILEYNGYRINQDIEMNTRIPEGYQYE